MGRHARWGRACLGWEVVAGGEAAVFQQKFMRKGMGRRRGGGGAAVHGTEPQVARLSL